MRSMKARQCRRSSASGWKSPTAIRCALLRLVNSLLDFARVESGRAQAAFRPTDLGPLTRDLASSFRAATDRAGLELEVDAPSLNRRAYVDRDMWETIVLNLLSNAFKFTHSGEIRVRLE